MKKTLCLFLFFLLPVVFFGTDIEIGFKGGITLSHMYGGDHTSDKNHYDSSYSSAYLGDYRVTNRLRSRFAGGLFLTIGITDLIAIQPEFLVAVWEPTIHIENQDYENDSKYISTKFYYINLPILLKFRFSEFNLFLGPEFFFRSYAPCNIEKDYMTQGKTEEKVAHEYKRMAFGGVVGFGYNIKFKKVFICLDTRYEMQFTSLDDFSSGSGRKNNRRQNSLTFFAGLGFKIGGHKDD